jgi:hypothetical protein
MPALLLCTFDAGFIGQAKGIDTALREYSDIKGELIRVNRPSR